MRIAIVLLLTFARTMSACSCSGEMHQALLDRAQFVAEVSAVSATEFSVERVIRGIREGQGRTFVVPNAIPVPRDCCDRTPAGITAGQKYWVIAPEQPIASGKRLEADRVEILKHDDSRATYLAHLHDLTPAELRSLLQRWKAGAIPPHEFSTYIDSVDVPSVGSCSRGYYHRLLMDLTYMAWGNEDHAQCAAEDARSVRAASASAALAALSFIENEGQAARLACARGVASVDFMPDLFDRQVRQTKVLYPCIDSRTREVLSGNETDVIAAAVNAYLNQMQGVNSKRPVSLYYTNVRPERSQLQVAVFSPANEDAARLYASPELKQLVDDLVARNKRSAQIPASMPRVQQTPRHANGCDPTPAGNFFADALAVSRPGFASPDKALVYLEYAGGARAYYIVRRNDRFEADWYVDLWQCG